MITNILKKFSHLSLLAAMLLLPSCGSDDSKEDDPSINLILRGASIENGAEVKVGELTSITLSYNDLVSVSANADITLNNVACDASTNTSSRMKIDIALPTLEHGTTYTLKVAEGAIVATNDKSSKAPALTLTFKTKELVVADKAEKITKMLGFGWNLGNHFDSYDGNNASNNYKITWSKDCPYWDGVNPTEDLYKNLAKAGVQTVRIPATWGPYEDMTDGNYTIDAQYMETIKKNVLWAKNNGLNVVLNTHHDEYWQDAYQAGNNAATNEQLKDRIYKTWTQIAGAFKEEGDYLILETFNELNHNWATPNSKELAIMNEWNQVAVNAIRNVGGENATRWIAVPSYQANPGLAMNKDFVLPTDPANRLIVAVHCYDPYNFTLADPLIEPWGHNAGNSWDEKNITDLLGKLKATFIDNDIPCYLGEFGCSIHTSTLGENCRAYYLEYFCRAAYFAGLAVTLWDNNVAKGGPESHGYFNHLDGSWAHSSAETLVPIMVKAATSTDASYTLESIYSKAPSK